MSKMTLREIAKKAGVAKSTASKILNNQQFEVSPQTRENILKIAQQHDYRPNYFARSLKTGKTNCIGLMASLKIMDFGNDDYTRIANGIENAIDANGGPYSLLVFGSNYTATHKKSVEMIERRLVDGVALIVLSQQIQDFEERIMPVLRKNNTPFVVIHSLSRELPYNNVGFNSCRGGYLAGDHLGELGYKDIMYLPVQEDSPQERDIQQGFRAALARHGVSLGPERIVTSNWTSWGQVFDAAYQAMMNLRQIPRALFCANDIMAHGALKALRERRARIPEDTAVVGFNDDRIYPGMPSELTSIHHPLEEKGAAGVTMLLEILNGERDKKQVHQTILEPRLVVRNTCGGE